jgi:hypothetical protein
MKFVATAIMVFVASLSPYRVAAQGYLQHDLVNCIWKGGQPMKERDCRIFRNQAAEDAASREHDRKLAEESERRSREAEAKRQEELERFKARRDEILARENAEKEEARARTKASLDQSEREEAARERREAANERSMKKTCGDDYRSPKVGMAIDRAKQCLGRLTLKGQVNRANGVISTYYGAGFFLHEMGGKVVAWGTF